MTASKYANINRLSKHVPVVIAENPILGFKMIWRFAKDFKKIHELFKTVGGTGTITIFLCKNTTISPMTQNLLIKLKSKLNLNNIYHFKAPNSYVKSFFLDEHTAATWPNSSSVRESVLGLLRIQMVYDLDVKEVDI